MWTFRSVRSLVPRRAQSCNSSSSSGNSGGTGAVYEEIARTALDRGFATRIGQVKDDNVTVTSYLALTYRVS